MNDTCEYPGARADLAWGRITRKSQSGSFVEDQLATLVDVSDRAGRFRVDVIYPDAAEGETS